MRIALIALLLCGCAVDPRAKITPPQLPPDADIQSNDQPEPQLILPMKPLAWTWDNGGYSNFVVVTSIDITLPLSEWQTYEQLTTNFFEVMPTNAQQFFTLYGTNSDGEGAWVTRQ